MKQECAYMVLHLCVRCVIPSGIAHFFLCNHEPTRPSVSACMLELQCSQFFKWLKHAAHKKTGQESFNWLLLPFYGLSVRAVAANLTSKLQTNLCDLSLALRHITLWQVCGFHK